MDERITLSLLIILIILITYLFLKRMKEKGKEDFEDRDN